MITQENVKTGKVQTLKTLPLGLSFENYSLLDVLTGTVEWRHGSFYTTAPISMVEKAKGEPVNWCKFCEKYVVNKCIWQSQKKHCKE
jgi:hypothetical protein